jgi:hypothetical protein
MYLSESFFSSFNSFKSLGEREKKAISEPEAKPENKRSKPAIIIAITAPIVGAVTVTSLRIC